MPQRHPILDLSDKELRDRWREVDASSPTWQGIVAELQYRAADKMSRQTRALIWLTWAIVFLTVALLAYTIKLDLRTTREAEQTSERYATPVPQATP